MVNLERYNRNILIKEVGESGQDKLINSKVLVAGAGGLGATVISSLSAVGVGTIGIVDNDKLELSNLNRQYIHKFENLDKSKVESAKDWVNAFNPDITVKTYPIRLNEDNYKDIVADYDLVIDCFDSYKSKFLLNRICVETGKTFIHGGVTEFYGQALTVIPNQSACLACIIPDFNPDAYVVKGVISPAVSTIASIQSMEAVKILLGQESSLVNALLTYDGLRQEYKKIKVGQNSKCPLCKIKVSV